MYGIKNVTKEVRPVSMLHDDLILWREESYNSRQQNDVYEVEILKIKKKTIRTKPLLLV